MTIEEWAIQGVISQAMAQGHDERWIRRELKKVGIILTWTQVEGMIETWEQQAYVDAGIANSNI